MAYFSKQQLLASTSFEGSFIELDGELAYVVPSGKQGNVTIQTQLRYSDTGLEIINDAGNTIPPTAAATVTVSGNTPPDTGIQKILPGSGFSGATAQPATQGTQGDYGWLGDVTYTPDGGGADITLTREPAKPIAHWDSVPYRELESETTIGVSAHHIAGIDRVSFSIDDGPWVDVANVTTNPDTGVPAYLVKIDPADLTPGEHEVRAIAYPTRGNPRVLQGEAGDFQTSLKVWKAPNDIGTFFVDSVNGDDETGTGTEANPFKTIVWAVRNGVGNVIGNNGSGGTYESATIKLKAGDHSWGYVEDDGTPRSSRLTTPRCTGSWLTIEPADGLTKNDVRISSCFRESNGEWANEGTYGHVRLRDVHVIQGPQKSLNELEAVTGADAAATRAAREAWLIANVLDETWNFYTNDAADADSCMWFDDCLCVGAYPYIIAETKFILLTSGDIHKWTTDSTFQEYGKVGRAFQLIRNSEFLDTSEDVFSRSKFVVNTKAISNIRDIVKDDGTILFESDMHNDFSQWEGNDVWDNYQFMNVIGLDQNNACFRFQNAQDDSRMQNFAFVNVLYSPGDYESSSSAADKGPMLSRNHFLFHNCTILQGLNFWDSQDKVTEGFYDISVRKSMFVKFDMDYRIHNNTVSPESGWWVADNHWMTDNATHNQFATFEGTSTTDYTNATDTNNDSNDTGLVNNIVITGGLANAVFTDPNGFAPTSSSILSNRGSRLVYFDAQMNERSESADSVGALVEQDDQP